MHRQQLRSFLLLTFLGGMAAPLPLTAAEEQPPAAVAAAPQDSGAEAEARAGEVFAQIFDALGEAIRTRIVSPRSAVGLPQVDPEMLLPHYVAEFTRQFRPLVTTELQFVERVCRPTPEERNALKATAEARLRDIVKEYADLQVKVEQDGYRSYRTVEWPNPRELLLETLTGSVRQTLSAEQGKRYLEELEKRAILQRQATLSYVVARLDRDLLLSGEQRSRLTELLNSSWQAEWAHELVSLQHYDRDVVPLPLADDQVLPLLSEPQQRIWSRWRKREGRSRGWTGFGFVHPLEEVEPEPEAEAQPEAAPAAAPVKVGGKP